MMLFIGGIVLVVGFFIFLNLFGVIEKSKKVINIAKLAASIVRDVSLDDYQKEIAMKKHSKRLFSLFFLITAGSLLALAIPFSIIWLMEFANILKVNEVIGMTLSLKFIVGTVIISIGYFLLITKKSSNKFVNKYSRTEKMLHNMAFKSWSLQVSLSNTESHFFKKIITNIEIKKPVFITALPRAGTTILLELCVKTNEFGSHTYRDMPFLLTPLFWNRFSRIFKQSANLQERAHGDGMMINVDSPEAFEEVIWKGFWSSRYQADQIIPWAEPNYPDFEKFLQDHLTKIVFLRRNNTSQQLRYISKNNLNIARIAYLKKVFPDSIIVVPFRAPLQHAASLQRQHLNFLKIHKEDSFACKYMENIGHYDFGKNLRPIDFDNWFSSEKGLDPSTILFWLQYWISTYQYLLKNTLDHITFFSYDSLWENPQKSLDKFGKLLEIKNIGTLTRMADLITAPKPYAVDSDCIPKEILKQTNALYAALLKISLH